MMTPSAMRAGGTDMGEKSHTVLKLPTGRPSGWTQHQALLMTVTRPSPNWCQRPIKSCSHRVLWSCQVMMSDLDILIIGCSHFHPRACATGILLILELPKSFSSFVCLLNKWHSILVFNANMENRNWLLCVSFLIFRCIFVIFMV